MKKYSEQDLNDIREKRIKKMSWLSRMVIKMGIMKFSIEPRCNGFDFWVVYRLNLLNPLTYLFCIPVALWNIIVQAPVRSMFKEAVGTVKTLISLSKGERYG